MDFVVFFVGIMMATASATSPTIHASQCEGPNEVYSSCPAGQCGPKTCDNLVNPAPCPRIIPPCPGGCICQEGYLRDLNGTCIEKNKCPNQCRKPNERYTNCLLGECVPKTCDDLGKPIACAAIAAPCAGGCICVDGFVRSNNGDCIEQKKCPSCGDDPYAQSGCGNPCGKTCDSRGVNKSELVCPQYCEVNGCDCKKGFLLDTDTKKCVPEQSCPKPPPPCRRNEHFYCGPSCPEPTCKNLNPERCLNKMCKPACFCKKGFVRNANNKCVTVGKCTSQCKGPREIYSRCPAGQCRPKTCDNLVNPAPCPRIISPCPGGCICRKGYLRDSNGKCIKKNKCRKLH